MERLGKNMDTHYRPSFALVMKRADIFIFRGAPAFAIGDRSLQRSIESTSEGKEKLQDAPLQLKGLLGSIGDKQQNSP